MQLLIKLFQVALKSLASHKLRSSLTMLGVIIGVGAVIVMLSIGEGAKRRVSQNIKSLGTNLLIVRPGFAQRGPVRASSVQTLTEKDAEAIQTQVQDVAALAPEVGKTAQVKALAKNTNTTILGTTEAFLTVNNYRLTAGRFLEASDLRQQAKTAVLGATPAAELFEGADPIGQTIKISGVNFTVIGVLEAKGQTGYRDPDDQVTIPITTAQKRLLGQDFLRAITVQITSEQAMDGAQATIESLLRERHRLAASAPADFHVRNQKEILDTMSEVAGTFTTLLAAVAAVAMLVGGIGIMNIMLVSVTERTREIGIRKALGARRQDVLFQFLVEAMVLSILGGLIGIAAGLGTSNLVGASGSWETVCSSNSVVLAFAIATATGIFFGFYPAQKASGLDPIEALRHE
jgi:putative ABC transport system permease protein